MTEQNIIAKFDHIEYGENNIELIYRNNFLLYKYFNSDKKFIEQHEIIIENGVIQNKLPIASNSYDKYQIEEKDFIKAEFASLNLIVETNLNYGQKIKLSHYKQYLQFKLNFPEWHNIKNRNGFYVIKESKIGKYKKAIYSGYFKDIYTRKNEDKLANEFHYLNRIKDWRKQRDKLLGENESLRPRLKLLQWYNTMLSHLMSDVVKLFEIADKYDGAEISYINSFNIALFELRENLENIGRYSQNINHNINTGHYKIALEIQHYCSLMFDDIIGVINTSFYIRIEKSPLRKDFENVAKQLSNAIDLEKLDFLLRVGGISRKPTAKDTEFQFTDTDKNIKNIEGQKIFERFHSYYSNQDEQSKNYSFLWYAFKKDNYTDLSQVKWISFLKNFKIEISFATRYKWEFVESEQVKKTYLDFQKAVRNDSENG